MNHRPIATHCILELHGCAREALDDPQFVQDCVREASARGLSTLLQLAVHKFEPQGVTAVGLLAESHLSIHTWPEHGYAAVDMLICGQTAQPRRACQFLARRFRARRHVMRFLHRGGDPAALELVALDDQADEVPVSHAAN